MDSILHRSKNQNKFKVKYENYDDMGDAIDDNSLVDICMDGAYDNLKENSNSNLTATTRNNDVYKKLCNGSGSQQSKHIQSVSRASSSISRASSASLTCSTASSSNNTGRDDRFHHQSYVGSAAVPTSGSIKIFSETCSNISGSVPKNRPKPSTNISWYPPPRLPLRCNSGRITSNFDDELESCSVAVSSFPQYADDIEIMPSQSTYATKLIRSQSVNSYNDRESKLCSDNIGKVQIEITQGQSKSSSPSFVSSHYQAARSVAERIIKALPGRSKSKGTVSEKKPVPEGCIRKEFLKYRTTSTIDPETSINAGIEHIPASSYFSYLEGSSDNYTDEPQTPMSVMQERQSPCILVSHPNQTKDEAHQFQLWLDRHGMNSIIDEDLKKRATEAQERAEMMSRQLDSLSSGIVVAKKLDPNVQLLQEKLRKFCEEKKNLAYEICYEIQQRITERYAANEKLKQAERELAAHTKTLENQKIDIQSSFIKEIDRRSGDWASMLDKMKHEEKRLRDRVRDLAEQNVGLQREVLSSNNREANLKYQVRECEKYAEDLRMKLEHTESEIARLQESVSETSKKAKEAEDNQELTNKNYREQASKNNELQKMLVRLQRLCNEQEKTITGLCQGLNEKVNNSTIQPSDSNIAKLQREQLRLINVEQALRRDLEIHRFDVDSLRQENVILLERVKNWEKDNGLALIKLDQELQERVDGLQVHALSLLDDYNDLFSQLLDFIKKKLFSTQVCEIKEGSFSRGLATDQERDQMIDFEMGFHRLGQRLDSLKESIRIQNGILKEKSQISCKISSKQDSEETKSLLSDVDSAKNFDRVCELQQELKAETLLAKVLREKLCSRESDLERLQEEVATLVRSREVLKDENSKLQNMFGNAVQKRKELQILLEEKINIIQQLQNDLKGNLQELTSLKNELPRVSKEKDNLQQYADQLSKDNKTLVIEVDSLKKRIEVLDEDILFKEGQISILQESLL